MLNGCQLSFQLFAPLGQGHFVGEVARLTPSASAAPAGVQPRSVTHATSNCLPKTLSLALA
jgi:hypothetical protein